MLRFRRMTKEDNERIRVTQLLEALNKTSLGTIENGPNPPDVLIRCSDDNTTIGVEVTEFFLPPDPGRRPHQELQSLKDRVVVRAWEIWAAGDKSTPIEVSVFFNDPGVLRSSGVESCAKKLATAVTNTTPGKEFEAIHVDYRGLPPGIGSVSLHRIPDDWPPMWFADAGGWVAPVGPALVQSIIDKKSHSCRDVLSSYDAMWLLIVGDEFSIGAPAELVKSGAEHQYEHPFDKVWWLVPNERKAYELGKPSDLED